MQSVNKLKAARALSFELRRKREAFTAVVPRFARSAIRPT